MLLSALSVSSLFGDSVHRMRSALIRALRRRCNLLSGLCSAGRPSSQLRSHPIRSEALSRASRGLHHFTLGSLLDAWGSPPLFSFAAPSRLSKRPTPLRAAWRCIEWIVDLCSHPQAMQEHRELPPYSHSRSLLLGVLFPRGRLSSLHDVVGQNPSRRDPRCSERCLPVAYPKHLISLLGDVFLRISIP